MENFSTLNQVTECDIARDVYITWIPKITNEISFNSKTFQVPASYKLSECELREFLINQGIELHQIISWSKVE